MEAGMARAKSLRAIVFVLFFAIGVTAPAQAQQNNMSFFITSVGVGRGGDLGGLEGADLQCQSLAQAAGRAARHGTPICPHRARPGSTPKTGLATGLGSMPRVSKSHRILPTYTTIIGSTRRQGSTNAAWR